MLCRWLDASEDDGLICRDLEASESDQQTYAATVTYKVTAVTADRKGAGTSANVFVNLYGQKGTSGAKQLEGVKNAFQKGQSDTFGVETVDLGDLTKIRVWHDNRG